MIPLRICLIFVIFFRESKSNARPNYNYYDDNNQDHNNEILRSDAYNDEYNMDYDNDYYGGRRETDADYNDYGSLMGYVLGSDPNKLSNGCPRCKCGVANNDNMKKIIGGWVADLNEYPWIVALSMNNQIFCGGTLINDRYVLTAAHCAMMGGDLAFMKEYITVVVAEHNIKSMIESDTEIRRIVDLKMHPGFKEEELEHDVALLKLDIPIRFRLSVRPVCLPPKEGDYVGKLATAAGWGVTAEGRPTDDTSSKVLLETDIPVMGLQECRNLYQATWVSTNMLCAGNAYLHRDTCKGDSGGPLMLLNQNGRTHLIGVVSWGSGCADDHKPGVYARVDRHLDWIKENTEDACYCH